MDHYIIDASENDKFHAGTKARSDINRFLKDSGWDLIDIRPFCEHQRMSRIVNAAVRRLHITGMARALRLRTQLRQIPRESVLLYQYPLYPLQDNEILLRAIRKECAQNNHSLVVLVHDLDSIRGQSGSEAIKRELALLDFADYIVVHNSGMAADVSETAPKLEKKLHILEIFDYKTSDKTRGLEVSFVRKITIAGNLSPRKAGYIYRLMQLPLECVTIDLYGIDYCKNGGEDHIRYQGVFSPEDIPFHSGFGLVWDGDSIDTCSGKTGEYTRINNPHKLSLYMAAGIPVIVWREAAIARFVEEHHVGLCVDSLREIDELLGAMTEETYNKMVGNVAIISERVRSGYYTCRVLQEIEDCQHRLIMQEMSNQYDQG